MVEKINSISNLSCKKPDGAFYVMVNITKLIGKTIKGFVINNSLDLCGALLEVEKVAAIPGSGFGTDNYIRLSYATSLENIIEGLNRIENFVK
jgi:aspartate aminotransferase